MSAVKPLFHMRFNSSADIKLKGQLKVNEITTTHPKKITVLEYVPISYEALFEYTHIGTGPGRAFTVSAQGSLCIHRNGAYKSNISQHSLNMRQLVPNMLVAALMQPQRRPPKNKYKPKRF